MFRVGRRSSSLGCRPAALGSEPEGQRIQLVTSTGCAVPVGLTRKPTSVTVLGPGPPTGSRYLCSLIPLGLRLRSGDQRGPEIEAFREMIVVFAPSAASLFAVSNTRRRTVRGRTTALAGLVAADWRHESPPASHGSARTRDGRFMPFPAVGAWVPADPASRLGVTTSQGFDLGGIAPGSRLRSTQ